MNANEESVLGAQSVDRALQVLTLVGQGRDRGWALSEIVKKSGLNKATLRRLLMALIRAGFVEQDEDTRRYRLGAETYVLGILAATRFSLHHLALDSLARLSAESEDTSFVSVKRDSYAVCLHREEGSFPIRTHVLKAGDRHPLGVGAGSLAILASLPDDEIDRVIDANGSRIADAYPRFSTPVMRGLINQTRDQGFSINPGLLMHGSWGIGMTVYGPRGDVVGALSIAAIEQRMSEARQYELSKLLHREAEYLRKQLQSFEDTRAGSSISTANIGVIKIGTRAAMARMIQ